MNEPEGLDDLLKDMPDWLKDKQKDHPDWWNDFKKWEAKFKESDLGEHALSKMKNKLSRGKHFKFYGILEDQVLKNCFFAKKYEQEKDKYNNLRIRYGPKFFKELKKQIDKINELRGFISKYPDIPEYGFKYNKNLKDKDLFFYSKKDIPPPFHLNFDRLLEIYSEILIKPKIPGSSAPKGYRFNFAGICYPSELPLDGRTQRTKIHTILAFRLIELFRQHTNPEGCWEITLTDFYRSMPEYGEPCYELAVDFISAIFEKILAASDIKKSVDDLTENKVQICPWPQQDSSFERSLRFFFEEGWNKPIDNKDGVLIPNIFL